MPRKGLFYIWMIWVLLMVQGCRSANPVYDTFTNVLPRPLQIANLQRGFEYLWVSVDGNASVMALGARETRGNAVHEHWHNAQGEMLYLVNGRVQQALGFTHELRHQTGAPPDWGSLVAEGPKPTQTAMPDNKALAWKRLLDVMPSYRYGVEELVLTRMVAEPARLPEGVPAQALWVVDEVQGKKANGSAWLYAQRFALVNNRVVYSEQCLAPAVCLKLRPLGVVVP